jgi:DNA-binding CsgD family transcriptional regulator
MASLTARERDILYLTVEGYSSTQIGKRLSISPRTVEAHRASLMRKLHVRTISQLIRVTVCRIAYPNQV